jgi:hypothetical protein
VTAIFIQPGNWARSGPAVRGHRPLAGQDINRGGNCERKWRQSTIFQAILRLQIGQVIGATDLSPIGKIVCGDDNANQGGQSSLRHRKVYKRSTEDVSTRSLLPKTPNRNIAHTLPITHAAASIADFAVKVEHSI